MGGYYWLCEFCGTLLATDPGVPAELVRCLMCVNAVVDCGDFAVRVKDER